MSQRSLCSDLAPTVSLVAAWFLIVALWGLLVFAVALDALILGDGERVEQGVTPYGRQESRTTMRCWLRETTLVIVAIQEPPRLSATAARRLARHR